MMRSRLGIGGMVAALLLSGPAFGQYGGLDLSDTQTTETTSTESTSDAPVAADGSGPGFTQGASQKFGQEGTFEATGTVGIQLGSVGGGFAFTMQIDPYLGYFIIDNVELGFRPGFILSAGDLGTETALNMQVVPNLHFDVNSWFLPYVGVGVGLVRGGFFQQVDARVAAPLRGGGIGMSASAEGGIKIPVGNAGLLRGGLQFQAGFLDGPNIYNTTIGLGAGVFF